MLERHELSKLTDAEYSRYKNASPDEQARMSGELRALAQERLQRDEQAFAQTRVTSNEVPQRADGASEPTSIMRMVGMIGFLLAIGYVALLIFSGGNRSTSSLDIVAALVVAGPLAGPFALMWMLGAIEMRLIQINQTLRRQKR